MLRVESINTFYGRAQILFDLTLAVKSGEVVVLLGRNGAGKTTTFKSIMGIVALKEGGIYFKDQAIQDLAPFKTCALGAYRH
jgi:branched-chain amino acid transport system ATP-binding protein